MDKRRSALIVSGGCPLAAEMGATFAREGYGVENAPTAGLDDSAAMAALVAQAVARLGGLDVIVFCADLASPAALLCPDDGLASITAFDETVSRNLGRLFLTMRHGLPVLAEAGQGAFVTACSIAAINGVDSRAGFSAASHAMLGLTRAAAMDLARTGVTVNAICLGLNPDGADPQWLQDAAATALYLTSPEARSVTATHFVIDGGQSAHLVIPADGALA